MLVAVALPVTVELVTVVRLGTAVLVLVTVVLVGTAVLATVALLVAVVPLQPPRARLNSQVTAGAQLRRPLDALRGQGICSPVEPAADGLEL